MLGMELMKLLDIRMLLLVSAFVCLKYSLTRCRIFNEIKYASFLEPGRPFFVERGASISLTLSPMVEKVRIPCLTNSEVPTSVFLYKMTENVRFS